MVRAVVGGYNGTILAFGQTGSGKTHTLLGQIGDVQVGGAGQGGAAQGRRASRPACCQRLLCWAVRACVPRPHMCSCRLAPSLL